MLLTLFSLCLDSSLKASQREPVPGGGAALLDSKCNGGDNLFYPSPPCGGCWHQHRPTSGLLPAASQVLPMSATRPSCLSHYQR